MSRGGGERERPPRHKPIAVIVASECSSNFGFSVLLPLPHDFCFSHAAYSPQVDSDLKPLPVNVRVGQAVETVGQAGKPKTITGFQTHTTPVLLGVRDRAEVRQEAATHGVHDR